MKFDIDYAVYERGKKSPQYTIETDLDGELSLAELLEFTKANLILIADTVLREEQAKGFDKNPITRVDGSKTKPVIAVKPFGTIEFTARQQSLDVLMEVFEMIFKKSPVDTGLYINSHILFWNGKQIAKSPAELKIWMGTNPQIGEKDLFRFVNIQPYARRLERLGVTEQRQKFRTVKSRDKRQRSGFNGMILAPNGTYFLTAKAIGRKYRNSLRFGFIPGSELGLTATFKKASTGTSRRRKKRKSSTYLYPSISLYVNETVRT